MTALAHRSPKPAAHRRTSWHTAPTDATETESHHRIESWVMRTRNMNCDATISARATGAWENSSARSCERKTIGRSSARSASHDRRRTAGDIRAATSRPAAAIAYTPRNGTRDLVARLGVASKYPDHAPQTRSKIANVTRVAFTHCALRLSS